MNISFYQRLIILIISFGLISCVKIVPPERFPGIPEDAVWKGGIDGGRWGRCKKQGKFEYYCQIYDDVTGTLESYGNYLHRIVKWNKEKHDIDITMPLTPLIELKYEDFEGRIIRLEGDDALVADGVITYPDSLGYGVVVKETYKEGILIKEEKIDAGK